MPIMKGHLAFIPNCKSVSVAVRITLPCYVVQFLGYLFNFYHFVFCSADESMKDIIQAKYTNLSADDNDYPDTSNIMKMSSFPKPIATKASEVLAQARKDEKAKKAEIPRKFCMKKFQNVESKIKLPGGPSSHRAASSQGFRTTSNSEV